MRKSILFLLLFLLTCVLGACGNNNPSLAAPLGDGGYTAENPLVIKFSHVTSIESVKGVATEEFARLVKEKTEGKVKVEVFPSSQLYGDNDELDALAAGNVHMIAPSATKLVKIEPRWQYTDLPFLFENEEHVRAFFTSDVAKKLLESEHLAKNNIKGLAFWENGFVHYSNNKRPLKTVEDFKGLKFRVQAGKVLEARYKALGAGSATISFGETYAALQQGTVDGQENTFNNFDTQKYKEVQNHLTTSAHARVDYVILVNKPFWESIPEALAVQVNEAFEEATQFAWDLAKEKNDKSFEAIQESGEVMIQQLMPEEREQLVEAFEHVYEEFEDDITSELIIGIKNLEY